MKAHYWFPRPRGKWGENKERIKDRGWFDCAGPRQWAAPAPEQEGWREGGGDKRRVKKMKEIESDKKRQRRYEALQQPPRKAHWGKGWLTGCFTEEQRFLLQCQSQQTVSPTQCLLFHLVHPRFPKSRSVSQVQQVLEIKHQNRLFLICGRERTDKYYQKYSSPKLSG